MTSLDSYNFKTSEKKWQTEWKKNSIYSYNQEFSREETYSIDTPPPTVSGQLHMGHIFSYTQTDFIARYQRMKGMNLFYPMGFDDNGLPTERLVEKQKNIKASEVDRDEFVRTCYSVIEEEEEKFEDLFSSLGLSVDWALKYQTISSDSRKISQLSFLDLVNKGQIYRAQQPVLWDPVDQTALAQADIEDKEKESFMHDINFKDEKGNNLVIATTRPELLPACVCILFHPEDERYKHLKDQHAFSPLFNQKVPIIPDELVKQDKGTGLVMCCTFGDTTDIIWWKAHKLPLRIMLDKQGRVCNQFRFESEKANEYFASLKGLKVNQARAQILEFLKNSSDLVRSSPVTQVVKCAERSGAPLEIIATNQWFVKTIEHKEALLQKSAELSWRPGNMKIKLDSWINSISWDWCISRQRFFGVPFPVWYSKRAGEEGKILLPHKDSLPIDPTKDLPGGYTRDEVIADLDVMDTWATSSISPQLSSLAINGEYQIDLSKHKKIFPFNLRPQAHEIIRTWAFYTMLKSYLHESTLPWENIMISGWCLAHDKTKMSKSKGNSTSPVSLIEEYGADVIRHWAACSSLGQDTAFSEDLLKIGKKLVNKIWNASKFASSHFERVKIRNLSLQDLVEQKIINHDVDLWILQKLKKNLEEATNYYENYEYAAALAKTEEFFWKDFCDNYLEISKSRCYNEKNDYNIGQISAIHTLHVVMKIVLLMFAPVVPHITEEIYSLLYNSSPHTRGSWPEMPDLEAYIDSKKAGDVLVSVLDLVRKAKAAQNLSLKATINELSLSVYDSLSEGALKDLASVTNSEKISSMPLSDAKNSDIYDQVIENEEGVVIGVRY
ncbi:MAG: valine--tRNA ligase [Rickettsiaceae bacterium]|nr:valine--tRNA ligase [Rickettsiaceae bacterium]